MDGNPARRFTSTGAPPRETAVPPTRAWRGTPRCSLLGRSSGVEHGGHVVQIAWPPDEHQVHPVQIPFAPLARALLGAVVVAAVKPPFSFLSRPPTRCRAGGRRTSKTRFIERPTHEVQFTSECRADRSGPRREGEDRQGREAAREAVAGLLVPDRLESDRASPQGVGADREPLCRARASAPAAASASRTRGARARAPTSPPAIPGLESLASCPPPLALPALGGSCARCCPLRARVRAGTQDCS